MDPETKNRFDALAVLWRGAWDNFNQRRVYEWKLLLVHWTAMGSFAVFILNGNWHIVMLFVVFILSTFVFFSHRRFLTGLADVNRLDRKIAIHYERIMQSISDSQFPAELIQASNNTFQGSVFQNWGHRIQITTTTLLCSAIVIAAVARTNFDGIKEILHLLCQAFM